MKKREGFVSNSSSSSFIVSLDALSARQLLLIQNHVEEGEKRNMAWASPWDAWTVEVNSANVVMSTFMDNFDMHKFLLSIGVKEDDIESRDY